MSKLVMVKVVYALLVAILLVGYLLKGNGESFFDILLFLTVGFSVVLQYLILEKLETLKQPQNNQ